MTPSTAFKSVITATRPMRYAFDRLTYPNNNRAYLQSLRGAWKGKPALIVGNGPSLNKTPFDEFENVLSIGMNKINLLFPKTKWRPTFITCINDVVVRQHAEVYENSEIPIILPWKNRWHLKPAGSNVHFFLNKHAGDFAEDFSQGVPLGCTVTHTALQFAYYLEADPIIIFGVDHSFVHTGGAQEYIRWQGKDVNHFDPNYFKHGSLFGTPDLIESERLYAICKSKFEAAGRKIFDATVDGKLRIFDRLSVDEAIALTRPKS
jgi:Protein of unknown function DUF115